MGRLREGPLDKLSTSSLPVAPLKERVAYEFKLILVEQCKQKRANWSTNWPSYFDGVPKGIKQKGKQSYLIEIPFELKTAA